MFSVVATSGLFFFFFPARLRVSQWKGETFKHSQVQPASHKRLLGSSFCQLQHFLAFHLTDVTRTEQDEEGFSELQVLGQIWHGDFWLQDVTNKKLGVVRRRKQEEIPLSALTRGCRG